jgi:hypothetical protein
VFFLKISQSCERTGKDLLAGLVVQHTCWQAFKNRHSPKIQIGMILSVLSKTDQKSVQNSKSETWFLKNENQSVFLKTRFIKRIFPENRMFFFQKCLQS